MTGSTGASLGISARSPPAKSTTNLRKFLGLGWTKPVTPPRPIRVPTQTATDGLDRAALAPDGCDRQFELRARHRRAVGLPEGDDVVVGLALGRDLAQQDAALAPAGQGLDPDRGAALVAERLVLVVGEIAVALQQPEAARIFVEEGVETWSCGGLVSGRQTHSPLPRHIERPSESWISSRHSSVPRCSFSPNQNMLVMGAMPSRSIGLRGNSWAVDVDGGDTAGRDAEAVGAGDALALQKRVGGERGVGRPRPDQPEAAEAREFLRPVERRCRSRARGRRCRTGCRRRWRGSRTRPGTRRHPGRNWCGSAAASRQSPDRAARAGRSWWGHSRTGSGRTRPAAPAHRRPRRSAPPPGSRGQGGRTAPGKAGRYRPTARDRGGNAMPRTDPSSAPPVLAAAGRPVARTAGWTGRGPGP